MASNHPHANHTQTDLSSLKGKILLVGLTGGIGSGKTVISDLLDKLGVGIIDSDLISRELTSVGGEAIIPIKQTFGTEFIDAQGALDRSRMRDLVFKDPQSRQKLEKITHPLIQQKTARQAFELAQSGVPYLVFVVPLLVESEAWLNLIDYLVVVDCPEEIQIARVMQRNNMTRPEVERILMAQVNREDRLAKANFVIENQASLEGLKLEVQSLHQKILQIKDERLSSS
ncbi:dephospho-CoA kinase [Polynucleobacter antarcticus]|uniref:Dephospho-CoA kinase n=1 Tax=Polynucleobacter antarcticus TaxID=1743162 RepID=A0A6M9PPE5_9BURK|nr:dephospho-CoA kinase [Polynucleobacter antarcticus]QKM61772.1 dephospho-CoA kinase [Polynucleobacter antarcticus]